MDSYTAATHLIAPLIPLWLRLRQSQGKEDAKRIGERFGKATLPRPQGTLVWLHAASVGEANSVLTLVQKIRERFPDIKILLTTGTVTSARLMRARLPKDVIHQYVPVDMPQAVDRFIWHWRPDLAFWVESEFWPNLISATHDYGCFMGVINARMSERSYASWQRFPSLIWRMLRCFDLVFAQSADDASRLLELGAREVMCEGNLKYDAALLPCDENALAAMKNTIGDRPVWLAASTHPGEETMIAQAHELLSVTRPNLLTIIAPRHPERGKAVVEELSRFRVALRSKKEAVTPQTQIYIADTLGELGMFYRASEIVFMGGSLVPHGGQNPLEPARLSCAIVTGPHTHNFADIYQEMEKGGMCLRARNPQSVAVQIDTLFNNSAARSTMQNNVQKWVQTKGGTAERILSIVAPAFAPVKKAA